MRRKNAVQASLCVVGAGALLAAGNELAVPSLLFSQQPDMSMAGGATVRAAGLSMTLRLPRGPYFLGEMLPVVVALRNDAARGLSYLGRPGPGPCAFTLSVTVAGGSPPLYALPGMIEPQCPAPLPHPFNRGQSLSASFLVPLTSSGRVRVRAQALLAHVTYNRSGPGLTWSTARSLTMRWPTVAIRVAPRAPADRMIRLLHVGPLDLPLLHFDSQVFIAAPRGAVPHLQQESQVSCAGTGLSGSPSLAYAVAGYWQPLRSAVLHEPGCPGSGLSGERWTILVGAPGYTIAAGSY